MVFRQVWSGTVITMNQLSRLVVGLALLVRGEGISYTDFSGADATICSIHYWQPVLVVRSF